jgi:hypothetical protein
MDKNEESVQKATAEAVKGLSTEDFKYHSMTS